MKNLYASVAALGLTAGAITFGIPAEAQQASDAQGQQAGAEAGAQTEAQAGAETGQADLLIVTVGDREIRQSDVVEAIEALPPQVRQTPPQMLFPAVVDQLITRGLMVERARAENLHEDPEVRAMIEPGAEALEEQALVDVWLRREIGERVTGEDVEKTIEALRATNPDLAATPGLVPQVTQALQVKAMEDISAELRQDAEITFYGPGGEPVDTEAQVSAGFEQGTAPASEPALAADEAPASQPALAADESTEMAAAETGGMEPDTEDLAAYGIKVATSDQFGEYLVSEDGKPLYMFTPDTQGTGGQQPQSDCYEDCANAWPPMLVDEVMAEGEAKAELAGTFERRNGKEQATYNGWPLYYFVQDQPNQPPQGQDKHGFGGEWYLLRPDGTKVEG